MKIAHVVTLVTPTGDFGGPVRVAVNLAKAQSAQGHEVTLLGTYAGYSAPPRDIEGVPAVLFPARQIHRRLGFAGMISPSLLLHLVRSSKAYDALHIHMTRDLVTLPTALLAALNRTAFVVQTHGMIDKTASRMAQAIDAFATRFVLRRARRVFFLNSIEHDALRDAFPTLNMRLQRLNNGVPRSDLRANVRECSEILFLARLHQRKRPLAFVQAANELVNEFPSVRFTLVGPDGGEGKRVLTAIEGGGADQITWEGPLASSQTLERMAKASIYVLPSIDEPFPMSVLEAMSVGLPCVVTDTCGLVGNLPTNDSLAVVDDSIGALVKRLRRLIEDDRERGRLAEAAIADAEQMNIDHIATEVLRCYNS